MNTPNIINIDGLWPWMVGGILLIPMLFVFNTFIQSIRRKQVEWQKTSFTVFSALSIEYISLVTLMRWGFIHCPTESRHVGTFFYPLIQAGFHFFEKSCLYTIPVAIIITSLFIGFLLGMLDIALHVFRPKKDSCH